jgi:hypothetical protein
MNQSKSFEDIVKACKVTNDYLPAWEKLANTEFFIGVLPQDTGNQTSEFRFVIHKSSNGEPAVIISENLEQLNSSATSKAIKMHGGKLISMLNPQVGILIALNDGVFGIPVSVVAWLRASIQPVA